MDDAQRGQIQTTAAAVYEEFFVPALFAQWPKRLLAAAHVRAGHRVLDLGCGTGVVSRIAVQLVGSGGHAVGLDPNPGMLETARALMPAVEWREGLAEALPFDDASFDAVVCQHALMFFEDREQAVSEMARVLVPGGRVAIATWASIDESPGYARMVNVIRRLFGNAPADALLAPFCLGSAAELQALLTRVFPEIEVTRHIGEARFASIADWVHTDVRGWTLSELLDNDMEQQLVETATSELAEFTDRYGRVRFSAPALFAVGAR